MNLKCTDILAVNETGLDDTISSGEVTVPGYALERNDRNRDGGGGGGCRALYPEYYQL